MKNLVLYVPLTNLGRKYPNLLLDKDIKLRFIVEADEANKLKLNALDPLRYKSVLIYRYIYKKEDDIFKYTADVAKILIFLQLFIDQRISNERYFRIEDITDKKEAFNKIKPSVEEKGIIRKWGKYNQVYEKYKLSFNWYSKSLDKYLSPREKILYLVIALEGILLEGVENELAYRFCLRGAYVFRVNKEKRKENFVLLQHAYRLRSYIVHSSAKKYTEEINKIGSMFKFRKELTNYLERLLQRLVENPELLENIDEKII